MNAITKRVTALVVLASMLTAVPLQAQGACDFILMVPSKTDAKHYTVGTPDLQVERTIQKTTSNGVTTTTTVDGKVGGSLPTGSTASVGTSVTYSQNGGTVTVTTETHLVKFYQMDDGTRWELDCHTGAYKNALGTERDEE